MGAIDTTYTFTATDTITSTKMNNIIDQTTFTDDAVFDTTLIVAAGKLKVNAQGITSNELAENAVKTIAIENGAVTQAKASNMLMPAGAVVPFAGAATGVQTGWLYCNGQAVSRTTYAALFAVISTANGAGDGSTTFNVPDLRGAFIRGWDDSRGLDPGRTFATYQADAFASHTHLVKEGAVGGGGSGETLASGDDFTNNIGAYSTSIAAGGTETRPKNYALYYCIKY
jgi:microcystin-dependent protein